MNQSVLTPLDRSLVIGFHAVTRIYVQTLDNGRVSA